MPRADSGTIGREETTSEYIVAFDAASRTVQAWTAWRLPFERLTPTQIRFREELRAAIAGLGKATHLHAAYTSQVAARGVDLENLLFYNVGTSAFRNLASAGLRFERSFASPLPPPTPLARAPQHHVRYTAMDAMDGWWHTTPGRDFAGCRAVPCTRLGSVAAIWGALKPVMEASAGKALSRGDDLALSVRVSAPDDMRLALVEAVKPLIDGAASALHSYAGDQLDEVVRRLVLETQAPAEQLRALLLESKAAVLGARALPHLRGLTLQWSPADDAVIAAEVRREPAQSRVLMVQAAAREALPQPSR